MNEELHQCQNGLCERQIGGSAAYCCWACSKADEGGFEIHEHGPLGHSEACSARWAQRQEASR